MKELKFKKDRQAGCHSKIRSRFIHSHRNTCIPHEGIFNGVLYSKKTRKGIIIMTAIEVIPSKDFHADLEPSGDRSSGRSPAMDRVQALARNHKDAALPITPENADRRDETNANSVS